MQGGGGILVDSYSLITIFLNVTCYVKFTDLVRTLLVYSSLFLHSLESCAELYLQTVGRKNNSSEQSSQSSPEKCHKLPQNTLLGGELKLKLLYCTTKCFSY